MANNQQFLETLLGDVLAGYGFRRRGLNWYRTNDDTVLVVNLQKSEWGGQYYINLGVLFREVSKLTSPKEHQTHARARLDSLSGIDASAIETALDLDNPSVSIDRRRQIIVDALRDVAVPFLEARSTLPQLRRLHAEGRLQIQFLTRAGRDALTGDTA